MKDQSKIQWTNFTGGPYMICSAVSPGCANCYAWDLMLARLWPVVRRAYKLAGFEDWETRPIWGDQATRVLTKGFWRDAIRVNKQAAAKGERVKWFPSMIDWLDKMPAGIIDQEGKRLDPIAVLADFLNLIRLTPNIDWLLLTKRTENWRESIQLVIDGIEEENPDSEEVDFLMWITEWFFDEKPPANVWIGCTVENQEYADKRILELLKIPAVCRFVSYEPALGPVDFTQIKEAPFTVINALTGEGIKAEYAPRWVDWIIVGGESGPKAREFKIEWAADTVRQCRSAGIACFVKQLGAFPTCENANAFDWPDDAVLVENGSCVASCLARLKDKKGGDMAEWPEDLRIREFPSVNSV
jgi:protein gp37